MPMAEAPRAECSACSFCACFGRWSRRGLLVNAHETCERGMSRREVGSKSTNVNRSKVPTYQRHVCTLRSSQAEFLL
eukprot:1564516-Pleurochrysis_carterae.AAC.1